MVIAISHCKQTCCGLEQLSYARVVAIKSIIWLKDNKALPHSLLNQSPTGVRYVVLWW